MIQIDRIIPGKFHQPKCFSASFKSLNINRLSFYAFSHIKALSGKTYSFILDLTGKRPGGSVTAPLIQKGGAKGIHILNLSLRQCVQNTWHSRNHYPSISCEGKTPCSFPQSLYCRGKTSANPSSLVKKSSPDYSLSHSGGGLSFLNYHKCLRMHQRPPQLGFPGARLFDKPPWTQDKHQTSSDAAPSLFQQESYASLQRDNAGTPLPIPK